MADDSGEGGVGGDHTGHMATSFTDLMASLMVIFVLLFVVTITNATKSRQKAQGDLLDELRSQLAASGLDTAAIRRDERDPYAIIVVMPDSLLFQRDSSKVRDGGLRYLEEVTPTLSKILCVGPAARYIDNVVVEGHTDTTFAGIQRSPDYGRAYNLRLSQARSMEVVSSSLGVLQGSTSLVRDCYRHMIAASGRGQEEPLPGVPGDDPRQRRVVFKIRVKADLVQQLITSVPWAP